MCITDHRPYQDVLFLMQQITQENLIWLNANQREREHLAVHSNWYSSYTTITKDSTFCFPVLLKICKVYCTKYHFKFIKSGTHTISSVNQVLTQ